MTQSRDETFVIESCQRLLPALRDYLESNRQSIQYKAKECEAKTSHHVRLVFQHAMSSICDSLSRLPQSYLYPDIRKGDSEDHVDLQSDAEAIRSTLAELLQEQKLFNDVLWEVRFPEGVPMPTKRTAVPPLVKKPVEAPSAGSEEKLASTEEDNADSKKAEALDIVIPDR